jgi:hypothetical protein
MGWRGATRPKVKLSEDHRFSPFSATEVPQRSENKIASGESED